VETDTPRFDLEELVLSPCEVNPTRCAPKVKFSGELALLDFRLRDYN